MVLRNKRKLENKLRKILKAMTVKVAFTDCLRQSNNAKRSFKNRLTCTSRRCSRPPLLKAEAAAAAKM
jgi:hypothetical protein